MKFEMSIIEAFFWAFSVEIESAAFATKVASNMDEEQLTQYMANILNAKPLTPDVLARAIGMDQMIWARFDKQKPRITIADSGLVAYIVSDNDKGTTVRYYQLSLERKPLFVKANKRLVKSLFNLAWERESTWQENGKEDQQ